MPTKVIEVDRATRPATLTFAPRFNVAVPFIDRHVSEGRGAKLAIRTPTEDVTYAELVANVDRAARVLLAAGLGRGDRLLMVIRDCPAFFYAFWGAIKAGIVPVPLNTLLRHDTYTFMIEDSGAAGLIWSPEYTPEVGRALEAAYHKPDLVLLTDGADDCFATRLAAASPAPFEAVSASEDADCFWLYSSGSTGRPKGTVHRHRDMVVTSEYYGVEVLGIREDDVCFSEAKLFFAYGLGNGMTFPLWAGATVILNPGRPGADSSFPLLERFHPTLYFGVPTLYAAYLAVFETRRTDFSSVRWCVSAGEALPANVLERWHEATGLWILDGIGSTEALHIFISNRQDRIVPGSSGTPVPGYRAKIVDENHQEIEGEGSGRLLVSGLSTARCYWNNPERTAITMLDDWLDTGDTYRRDTDGIYYYCGRSDDMMKVGGIWCSAFDIESRIIEHAAVLECAVVGQNDPAGLLKPHAYVVLKDGLAAASDGLREELLVLCKTRLAPYQYPRWITFLAELPKTATGKIQRFRLRGG